MGLLDALFGPNIKKLKEKKDVEKLIQALKHKKHDIRREATWALGEIGDPRAVEPLTIALKDKNAHVRKGATWALGEIGDPRAIEPLIIALKDKKWHVRWGAVKALGKIGEPAIEPLIIALKDKNPHVRKGATKALEKVGKPAIEPLTMALKDNKSIVQKGAAKALEEMGWEPRDDTENMYYLIAKNEWEQVAKIGEAAVEPLTIALKDKKWHVREGAAKALGEIGDPRAVEPLIIALKDKKWHVRWKAAEALGKIGEPAIKPLIRALKNKDSIIREGAVKALGKIGEPAIKPLIRALKDKNALVRKGAAEALGKIGEPAIEPLTIALKDKNAHVREGALKILEEMGWEPRDDTENMYYLIAKNEWEQVAKIGEAAVKPLIRALRDNNPNVRETVAKALGEIGDPRAVEPLIRALKDTNPNVRRRAAKALGEIGDKRAADALLNYLFTYQLTIPNPSKFNNIFGDYTQIIFDLIHIENEYTTDKSDKALSELCKLNTPISNNLLYKIKTKKDIEVFVGYSDSGNKIYKNLNFEHQRKKAEEELKKRGNPPYNPKIYLDEKAWKLET